MTFQGFQAVQKIIPHFAGILHQIFFLDDLDIFQSGGAGHRMISIGMQMEKIFNRLHNLIGTADRRKGNISAGEPFRHRQQVRLNLKMLDTEHFPGAAKTANNLVDNEQDTVFVANLPHNRPIFPGRRLGPEPLHDRFADKGGNQFRIFKLYRTFDVPGTP